MVPLELVGDGELRWRGAAPVVAGDAEPGGGLVGVLGLEERVRIHRAEESGLRLEARVLRAQGCSRPDQLASFEVIALDVDGVEWRLLARLGHELPEGILVPWLLRALLRPSVEAPILRGLHGDLYVILVGKGPKLVAELQDASLDMPTSHQALLHSLERMQLRPLLVFLLVLATLDA